MILPPLYRFSADVDRTPPSPAPTASLTETLATAFTVTIGRVSGEAGTTVKLEVRPDGSADAFTVKASRTSAAVGQTLEATGLATQVALQWRITETDASGNVAEGTYGTVTPAAAAPRRSAGPAAGGFFSETKPTYVKPTRTRFDPWSGA